MNTYAQSTTDTPRTPAPVPADFALAVDASQRALARGWLWLGIIALVTSGLFSVLLVLARTPGVNAWLPGTDFFRVALVLHVVLSVLVWFVAVAGMLWSISTTSRGEAWSWVALGAAGAGTVLMSVAPFVSPGTPIMANYIPVIESPPFIAGLVVFGVSAALLVLRTIVAARPVGRAPDGAAALRFGLNAAAVSAAVALIAFVWSVVVVPAGLDAEAYYEIVFWGGGHALQFTWTLLMLVAWLWLASACGGRVPLSPRVAMLVLAIALISVFATPYAYLAYPDITGMEHRDLHTWVMRFGGGVAILPIALAVVLALARAPRVSSEARVLRAALISSIVLFTAGGVIGMMISGSTVKIPAHYHGSIVGVTLALMGLVYYLMPRLGWGTPRGRLAVAQPYLYGTGQLLHIAGLMWAGGYGVQRKVAGADQVLQAPGQVFGMGLMGAGGLLAIIGGLLFVVVVARAMRAPAAR